MRTKLTIRDAKVYSTFNASFLIRILMNGPNSLQECGQHIVKAHVNMYKTVVIIVGVLILSTLLYNK